MQLDTQSFLRLAEQTGQLAFVDIESTGLKGDYNSVLVVSIKPFGKKPYAFVCDEPGDDKELLDNVGIAMSDYLCWVTYYGKGFDIPMLNTRRLNYDMEPLPARHHIDMYFTLRSKLLTGRRSQGHLLEWLDTPEKKMSVGANEWNKVLNSKTRPEAMQRMVKRCNSDTAGLECLYRRTSHLISDVRKG